MSCYPSFIEEKISQAVYSFYLQSLTVEDIANKIRLIYGIEFSWEDVNEIIDYYNELFV